MKIYKSNCPRVLMLSWEYPPNIVGGLSRHVYDLSRYLVLDGWEVHVITTAFENYPLFEMLNGVYIHRTKVISPFRGDFMQWVFQLNHSFIQTYKSFIKSGLYFDIVHAHDWMVYFVAKKIQEESNTPLIATIHATEYGRNSGIYTDLQRRIHHIEENLVNKGQKVIVCSQSAKQELEKIHHVYNPKKIHIIPNGIEPNDICTILGSLPQSNQELQNDGRTVLFIGRLVYEKGVHLLLQAIPKIIKDYHGKIRFVIVGKGPEKDNLIQLAAKLGVQDHIQFKGFVSDEERNFLLNSSDLIVIPSLYEPFGIVALEAMAAKLPVVAANVGGLADIIEHGKNGLKFNKGDVDGLAKCAIRLLNNSQESKRMTLKAYSDLKNYDWNNIAKRTADIYRKVIDYC